ncbi:surface antigen-like protein, partial [Leptomonas seymouri]
MARSVLSLVGLVALLVILHAAVPGRADIELNTITSEWLVEWLKAIPNLKIIWMSPEICSRSGIVCSDDQKTLAIRLDSVTTAGFNLIGTLPEVPTVRGNSVLQVTGVSVRGKLRISGTIPESWSKMPLLTTLDLSRTGITGSIPDSLNALNSLVSAYFAGSYFC